jgi:hypothetical protein
MTMESSDPRFGADRDQWPLFRTMGAAHLLDASITSLQCAGKGHSLRALVLHASLEFWSMRSPIWSAAQRSCRSRF